MVATNYVISSAHCFVDLDRAGRIDHEYEADEIVVVIGDDKIITKDGKIKTKDENKLKPLKTIRRNVKRLEFHPDYRNSITSVDGEQVLNSLSAIVILQLQRPVNIEKYKPACMARRMDTFYDKRAWVAGWGAVEQPKVNVDIDPVYQYYHYDNDYPEGVYEAQIPVRKCPELSNKYNTTNILCAWGRKGKTPCSVRYVKIITSRTISKHFSVAKATLE